MATIFTSFGISLNVLHSWLRQHEVDMKTGLVAYEELKESLGNLSTQLELTTVSCL